MVRYISIYDLLSYEDSKRIVMSGDSEAFKKLLHDIGFDTKEDIEMQECLHRPMVFIAANKTPVYGLRFVGEERTDDEWVKSGHCSHENKLRIIGRTDVGFQRELLNMCSYPKFTLMACDYLKSNSGE